MKYLVTIVQKTYRSAVIEADNITIAKDKAEAFYEADPDNFEDDNELEHEVSGATIACPSDLKIHRLLTPEDLNP